ncbi:hypothetical protein A2W14_05540 [Candidatus Gottesmanbacteria bacterium RBG_16_37_8]|uniref:Yip1 domain-containing protein n=1 Tax=Candidatus Gottesmanbacteria bacterium RBG_16_37_8 TaxID=1798371 RepID=A0A1F5YV05_9BACT|nr:MAG: hypothetical protein A2W14_05540 [Candidatus Gottesmanbacteria bacterium RBG_16_37_8]
MSLIKPFILFLRNSIGTITSPYVAYRQISQIGQDKRQIIFIHLLIFFYFLLTSVLKIGLKNPFLLTVKFNSLYFSVYLGFALMLCLFYLGYRLLSSQTFPFVRIILLWSYSLWPTLFWFFTTSFFYLILPPPRSISYPGKLYSLSYLAFSLTLLFWKSILYYLTLRFGLRFDLFKIILISLIIIPLVFVYSIFMYRLGIFKIPFI